VTLEPCCHTNKKTPPCAPRLIEAKIARVFVGCLDPNPEVNGQGIAMLRQAGVEVVRVDEFLEAECKQLIISFIAETNCDRPYYTAKWAQSANCRIAGKNGQRVQITGAAATRLVHQLRARSDAIVVGINTVLTDDPLLTARGVLRHRGRTLRRVVLDRNLQIPLDSKLVTTARGSDPAAGEVIVLCSPATYRDNPKVHDLQMLGVEVDELDDTDGTAKDIEFVVDLMTFNEISHILFEPGPSLARSILTWVDRLWVFHSPITIDGGPIAPTAAIIPDDFVETARVPIGEDVLVEYLNTRSSSFFAAVPSADFVLASESASRAT